MRALFVSENIGGHRTVHLGLAAALPHALEGAADFVHVPPPGLARRLAGAPLPGLARLDLDLQPLRAQLAAAAWVRRRVAPVASGYDVVHLYTANAGLLSTRIMATTPTVVTVDTTNALNAYRLPYRHPTRFTPWSAAAGIRLERRVHDHATLVVANSHWAARSLRQTYGVPDDKVRVIPFGVTVPDPPAARPAGRPTIAFVGQQMERKGGTRLLHLYERHLADRCDLALVTGDRVVAGPGVRVHSDVTPGSPRLWEILSSAGIFCFPSEIDHAPNAVLEAMAAGLPVVSLAVGAIPEMVVHGETGLLLEPGDDRGLLAALRALLDDPDRARAMGAAGRRRVVAHYDMADTARRLVEVLHEAVDMRAPRPQPLAGSGA